ncbi:hypothetical protein DPMN_081287 [Dreissena polymorpha]|uniref:Uncharacterized protein n=1 Tax=Dreissena polymorpha TaxID=45954 RepID=A0A9D4BHL8_DREPO|nr:hypothetical protein DPMN_081287 [Dreissena polymorpha]
MFGFIAEEATDSASKERTALFQSDCSTSRTTCKNDPVSREEVEKRTKLQSLCETRWASRADTLHTFLCAYRTLGSSLEQLSAGGDAKASGYLLSVLQFDFIITLVVIEHVLASLVPLSKMLQGKSCDLLKAATETRVVKDLIRNERADDTACDALYEKAVDIVVPSMPRNARETAQMPQLIMCPNFGKITRIF